MRAVLLQAVSSIADCAGLEKEKRSQDDERMIEPEARRKTKVRNTIVCKADILREREERPN